MDSGPASSFIWEGLHRSTLESRRGLILAEWSFVPVRKTLVWPLHRGTSWSRASSPVAGPGHPPWVRHGTRTRDGWSRCNPPKTPSMALFRPPLYALGNSVGLGYFKLAFLVTLGRGCQALHCTGGAWPGSRTGEQQRESWNSESKPVGGWACPPAHSPWCLSTLIATPHSVIITLIL